MYFPLISLACRQMQLLQIFKVQNPINYLNLDSIPCCIEQFALQANKFTMQDLNQVAILCIPFLMHFCLEFLNVAALQPYTTVMTLRKFIQIYACRPKVHAYILVFPFCMKFVKTQIKVISWVNIMTSSLNIQGQVLIQKL